MSRSTRPRIAILADFQPCEADPNFPKPIGHYAVWLSALFHAFEQQDEYEIHWVTLNKAVTSARIIESKGQFVHVLPRGSRTIGQFTRYARERWAVARALRQVGPVLVHAWGTEDCYALCGGDFRGKRLLSLQGSLTGYVERGQMPPFFVRQSHFEKKSLRHYQDITTESPWAEERVRELAPQAAIHHLEYAVERRFFDKERDLSETPSVLYAGSDTPLKNIETLIQAFRDERLSHVTLNLAGVSEDNHPNLPHNIRCLGRISRDEVVHQMQKAWGLVHASLADTGPTVVKEARVMGLPVALSTECGSKQHVEEGKSGFIIPPHDTEGFIRAVLAMTRDRQTSLSMGAWGQEACRRALSAETMHQSLCMIYTDILSRPSTP